MMLRGKNNSTSRSYSTDEENDLENFVFGNEKSITSNLEKSKKDKSTDGDNVNEKKSEIADSFLKRKPVWQDDDDDEEKPRKNSVLYSKHYGTPLWADLDLKKKKKKKKLIKTGDTQSSDEDTEDEKQDQDYDDLFQHTGNFLVNKKGSSIPLARNIIDIKICTDANKEEPQQNRIKAVEFHPSARVILTAGLNQKLTLFQVDGKTNPKIQTIFIDKFPILAAHFSRNGEEIIIGSRHKSFYYYDMIAGKMISVTPPVKAIDEYQKPAISSNFQISPDNKYIAFVGSYGQVHLFSMKSKEYIETLKINGTCEAVSFSNDCKYLFTFGDDKAVNVFDMNNRGYECLHKFNDYGCLSGTSIAVSNNSQFIATGCKSGVVNLYDLNQCLLNKERNPKPLKSFMNLTTPCTSIKFNCTDEIIAACSSFGENACKLIHVSSKTVFTNFPLMLKQSQSINTQIRIPECIDFSPNSGYFTIGNHKGNALLYRLKHYGDY